MIKRLCPDSKMSCIRKFNRHIIDYKTTANMAIICCLISLVDVGLIVVDSHFRLSPQIVFFIDSIVMVLLLEASNQCFTLSMVRKEIPCIKDPLKGTTFYVRKEKVLVPRPQKFTKFSNIPRPSSLKFGILSKEIFPNLILTVDPETNKFKEKLSNRTKLEPFLRSNSDFVVNKNNIGLSRSKPSHYSGNRKSKTRSTTTAVLCAHTGGEDTPSNSLTSID